MEASLNHKANKKKMQKQKLCGKNNFKRINTKKYKQKYFKLNMNKKNLCRTDSKPLVCINIFYSFINSAAVTFELKILIYLSHS